jgi:hypothetical protein
VIRTLDVADLVMIAASAASADPDDVLAACDVAVLSAVTGRSAVALTLPRAAAELLVGVAASRPFASGNSAAAWLATAHLLALNRRVLQLGDSEILDLVAATSTGALDERGAAARIASALRPVPGPMARCLRWLLVARPSGSSVRLALWPCPACGREVAIPMFAGAQVGAPTSSERVTVCARQHHIHGRDGMPVARPPAGEVGRLDALGDEVRRLRACLVMQ